MPYTLSPLEETYDLSIETLDELQGRAEVADRWILNFGPQHPATHTTLRLVLELDGERIVRATPHIGYLHSGFEKLGEHHNFNQYVCTTSRMDYVGPIVNNIAWHHAVETLLDIDLTPRCKVIRTILGELGRIQNHLLCVGAAALDLGAFTGFLYGFNEREHIYDIMDFVAGQRFHPDYTRVGGLKNDLPCEKTFIEMVTNFTDKRMPKAIGDIETLLNTNRIFIDRVEGVGIISEEEATAWSLTGPLARASGVKRDIRKAEPYLCFADNWDGQGAQPVEFQIPIAKSGDCLARYHVRLEEIKQSCDIIRQLIYNIPGGSVDALPSSGIQMPPKEQVYNSIQGTIQQFELVMPNRGWTSPVGEVYSAIEGPNGEYGYFVVADGGPCAWRCATRPCSFINFQTFAKMFEGHQLADLVAVLGSLNIIAAELDR
mgnify:FL=1